MFPVHPIWSQDPILKMSCANPETAIKELLMYLFIGKHNLATLAQKMYMYYLFLVGMGYVTGLSDIFMVYY